MEVEYFAINSHIIIYKFITYKFNYFFRWLSIDGTLQLRVEHDFNELTSNYDLCITGEGLVYLQVMFLILLVTFILDLHLSSVFQRKYNTKLL